LLLLNKTFYDCVKHAGIVSVCSSSKEGKGHIANTWNKYLIVTREEKILIPCFGFRKTENNVKHDPELEVIVGSHEVQGKVGRGTGFLLKGTAEFQKQGTLFEEMHAKCVFANRVLVFTPVSCEQTI
jgi:hypothetical protein